MKNKDLVFKCYKCDHNLFIEIVNPIGFEKKLVKKLSNDCPNCGEEGFENWIFVRLGNYDKEYPNG